MTDKKTRTATREEKITKPGLYDVPVTQESLSNELAEISRQVAAPKNKGGRPTKYCPELVDEICRRLSLGEGLASICKDVDMPAQSQIYVWLNKHPEFQEAYVRAREEQAETHADQIVAIADETPETVPVYDKDGNQIDIKLDSAYIAWQKQRIDARKWNAAKQRPKKYGDRVTHGGDDESPVVVEHNLNVFGDLLKAIKLQRQSEA
jgi:hypothetical protein